MRPQLTTLFALATAFYVPHLAEEALTRMHDDPIIVMAFTPLAMLTPRHAAYLTFQTMLLCTLVTTLAFAQGGRWRLGVMAALGLALLAEGHHIVRALASLRYNSGLVTSLPMPLLGMYVLLRVVRDWPHARVTPPITQRAV